MPPSVRARLPPKVERDVDRGVKGRVARVQAAAGAVRHCSNRRGGDGRQQICNSRPHPAGNQWAEAEPIVPACLLAELPSGLPGAVPPPEPPPPAPTDALTDVRVGVQVAAQLLLAALQGALYLDGVVQVPQLLKLRPDALLLHLRGVGGAGDSRAAAAVAAAVALTGSGGGEPPISGSPRSKTPPAEPPSSACSSGPAGRGGWPAASELPRPWRGS